MQRQCARVLVVDDEERTLFHALKPALGYHDVEVATGAFDAIYRIDHAGRRPHAAIFRDIAMRDELSGAKLWACLTLYRGAAAKRIVHVVSSPLPDKTFSLLARIPNPCVFLPANGRTLNAVIHRSIHGPAPSGLGRGPCCDA